MNTRSCPVCSHSVSLAMYAFPYSDGTYQNLVSCGLCKMVYASESPAADYTQRSKYSVPAAIGSGESVTERKRMDEMVLIIAEHLPDPNSLILDVGCARGGLLEAFQRAGFANAIGLDPSPECVSACEQKGLKAFVGDVYNIAGVGNWDCIVLSHVLEHLWDVRGSLTSLWNALAPRGILYVEVPNALRYVCDVPFLEVNREHVNHFSLTHLMGALVEEGFQCESAGSRYFSAGGVPVTAIYTVVRKPVLNLPNSLSKYLVQSENQLAAFDRQLQVNLPPENLIVWGFGEFAQTLLRTKALMDAKVVQLVDRDPGKHGQKWGELMVESPSAIRSNCPILVASIVNQESIVADIAAMGLNNSVITLEGE